MRSSPTASSARSCRRCRPPSARSSSATAGGCSRRRGTSHPGIQGTTATTRPILRGNCGHDCPDRRCAFGGSHPICGANSHPAVLSLAGVDTKRNRVGYSSQGPGRLTSHKPDLAAYTHFKGSGVYPADRGTSAACPVAAGVVAAVRTKYSASKLTPHQLGALLFKSAIDRGGTGYDYDYGWGIVDP